MLTISQYGVCVFRATGLDDTRHVEFSRLFGELDDIKPYLTGGRKAKFPYLELFDAGNTDDKGEVIGIDSQRAHYNKVRLIPTHISSDSPAKHSQQAAFGMFEYEKFRREVVDIL